MGDVDYLEATKFYCKELNINPVVTVVLEESSEVPGACGQHEDGTFSVYLSLEEDLMSDPPVAILAHELVHVKQYLEGTLVDLPEGKCLWKGKIYLDPCVYLCDQLYLNAPWEHQAFALQHRLHQSYLRSLECTQRN